MQTVLLAIQILTGLLVTGAVLVQSKGGGLGKTWGGSGGSSSFTRRGFEKLLFKATFAIAGIFLLVSIIQILI